MTPAPIRVLLVDNSSLALTILQKLLSNTSRIEVVGTATNGREALELIPGIRPDVICTDIHMPGMDGAEMTREIMKTNPLPILLVTISGSNGTDNKTFKALEYGAVDVFQKPRAFKDSISHEMSRDLIQKIEMVSGVYPIRRSQSSHAFRKPKLPGSFVTGKTIKMIGIGASTGGPNVLQVIFNSLPQNFPVPILCVQHIEKGFLPGLVDWLGSHTRLKVRIARSGELPEPGVVYFPEDDTHLKIDQHLRLNSSSELPVNGHRPSVDVLFNSLAEFYGPAALAILLTGMGNDGAEGMRRIWDREGTTLIQNEESCVVYGMPQRALELNGVRYSLSPDEIVKFLLANFINSQKK